MYLKGKEREQGAETKTDLAVLWFAPEMTVTVRTGPGCSQEP